MLGRLFFAHARLQELVCTHESESGRKQAYYLRSKGYRKRALERFAASGRQEQTKTLKNNNLVDVRNKAVPRDGLKCIRWEVVELEKRKNDQTDSGRDK